MTRYRAEDAFLDKISDLLARIAKLEEENAYLSATLLACQEA